MIDLKDAWWRNLSELRVRTDRAYAKAGRDIWQVTAERMIALRKWMIKEERLIPLLQELGVYYVPKTQFPGPMFVFPQYDATGALTRAQTRPLHDAFGPGKYHTIGVKKDQFYGPVWFGNTDLIIQRILDTRRIILVEGPFDLIAARVAAPELPIMSSLTKSIGGQHEAYLKLLGVQRVDLLFDDDVSEAGQTSVNWLVRTLPFDTRPIPCPGHDPSACLERSGGRIALRSALLVS